MTKPLPELTQYTIVAWRHRGLSFTRIAKLLKLTKGQVAGVIYRAGLCKPERNPIRKRR